MLIIDLETRSACDLIKHGVYNYANHPTTEIIYIGFKFQDVEGVVTSFRELPKPIFDYLTQGTGLVAAHNAQFDRLNWNVQAPEHLQIPLKRWYCTAAQMRVNALPASLADASRALFGKSKKDIRGPQLIKLLSLPQPDGTFNENPALMQEMREYCLQDVRATYDIMTHTRLMSAKEHGDYLTNEQINDDGVCIDKLLATNAVKYAQVETNEAAHRLTHLTGGDVTRHTQVARVRKWVMDRTDDSTHQLMTVYKKGEKKLSLDKSVRQRLQVADDEHVITLPQSVREVLDIVDESNRSSVAKFQKMLDLAGEDDRVRGAFVYAGASQTLRFASRGLQVHNFTRDCLDEAHTEAIITDMIEDRPLDQPMRTLSKALRPAIVAEDNHTFVIGDWSSIEARALPWLSDSPGGDDRLNVFRAGKDLYQITTDQLKLKDRQIGKVVELSLGFSGGPGALQQMATNYGVILTESRAQDLVKRWRLANTWAVTFWNQLETAARLAVATPGYTMRAGRVNYTYYSKLIDGTLVATLPGGHQIQYPRTRIEPKETPFGVQPVLTALKANWCPAAGEKEWPRIQLWRGVLVENVTQAFCAALLRDKLKVCVEKSFPVVAHVHDELVGEVPAGDAKDAAADLKMIMEDVPEWAEDLPLQAEVKIMPRYGK